MRTHNPYYARSEYHTQLAKMSFDKIFDLTAGEYFNFHSIRDAGTILDITRTIEYVYMRRLHTSTYILVECCLCLLLIHIN